MTEIPFFFSRGGVSLFGIEHRPEAAPRPTAFVMCHPFAEEKLWAHRVFVSFARALVAKGHAVMRFDFMGAGDSDGMTPDTSLESHLADTVAAIATLRARYPQVQRVGLVGLRLGASIAALVAEQTVGQPDGPGQGMGDGAPLILWDPVVDGEAYFQEVLRTNLTAQIAAYGKVQENREVLQQKIRNGGTVNIDGYELGKALFESCARTDLIPAGPYRHAGPVLVAQLAANEQAKERQELRTLAESHSSGTFARVVEQPFWREIKPFYARASNLQQTTLSWLEQSDG